MSPDLRLRPRGLPEPLPAGEYLLWQGRPDLRGVVARVVHVPKLAVYFGLLLAYYAASSLLGGAPAGHVSRVTAELGGVALVPVLLLLAYAWAVARTTIYTVTSRRVVIRYGIALQVSVNLPFSRIDGAAVSEAADGSGDLVLTLAPDSRVSYLMMWPHVRPWHLLRPQPALRAVPEVALAAKLLGGALAAAAGAAVQPAAVTRRPAVPAGATAAVAA
jgi:hypothetical protein